MASPGHALRQLTSQPAQGRQQVTPACPLLDSQLPGGDEDEGEAELSSNNPVCKDVIKCPRRSPSSQ